MLPCFSVKSIPMHQEPIKTIKIECTYHVSLAYMFWPTLGNLLAKYGLILVLYGAVSPFKDPGIPVDKMHDDPSMTGTYFSWLTSTLDGFR